MFKNRPNKCIHTEEGDVWVSRSVAVVGAVFLLHQSKLYVLITRRAEHMPDEPNRWCLPCGYLDWDETTYEATVREIYEESCLNLNLGYKFHAYPDLYIDSSNRSAKQNVSMVTGFLIESDEFPDIDVTEETNDVAWCDVESVGDKNLTFGHHDVIRFVQREIARSIHLE